MWSMCRYGNREPRAENREPRGWQWIPSSSSSPFSSHTAILSPSFRTLVVIGSSTVQHAQVAKYKTHHDLANGLAKLVWFQSTACHAIEPPNFWLTQRKSAVFVLCTLPCRPLEFNTISPNGPRKTKTKTKTKHIARKRARKIESDDLWARVRSINWTWASPHGHCSRSMALFYILDSLARFFAVAVAAPAFSFLASSFEKEKHTVTQLAFYSCFSIFSLVSLLTATDFWLLV